MKDKPVEININELPLQEDIETEYVLGHEEFDRVVSLPESIELLYLIQDNE